MSQTGFIVAIDLGTSNIVGVVGRKNEHNIISVMAHAAIPSGNAIRRGLVYNIEETGALVLRLKTMLENKLNKKIGKAYISLAGQSLHTVEYSEMRQMRGAEIITEELVNRLRKATEKYRPELKKCYAIADVEYLVDEKPEKNPVGVTCSEIEANYQLIVGRPNLISNIEKSVYDKAKLQVADYVVGPLACANIALTEEDKQLGCAFIDFGAGTTTVSIYKEGILRRMVVIPFGGKNITRDICELSFIESEAEQYKIKFGKAKSQKDAPALSSPFSKKKEENLEELNHVIQMRLNELVANIKEQIKQSGYEDELRAGLIITGGASQLEGLPSYLSDKLKMEVRKVSAQNKYINNASEIVSNPAYAQVLGVLLAGDGDCEEIVVETYEDDIKETKETPIKKQSRSIWGAKVNRGTRSNKSETKTGGGFGKGLFEKIDKMFFEEDDDE